MEQKESKMTVKDLLDLINKYINEGKISLDSHVIWQSDEFSEYGIFRKPEDWVFPDTKIIPFDLNGELKQIESRIKYRKELLSRHSKDEQDYVQREDIANRRINCLKTLAEIYKTDYKNGLVLGGI